MTVTAYIKPTNFCTVGCEHCYLTEEVRADKTVISDDKLRDTARLLLDLAKKEGQDSLHIIWHGGEPMMLKPEWYMHAIKVLNEELGEGTFTQGIQSSMMPYNESWNELVNTHFDGFIGSSIDFSQRSIGQSQEKYISRWLSRVNKARENNIEVIPSMVPSRHEVGHGAEIVNWFEQHNFPAFNVEKYSDIGGGHSLDATLNKHHSDFMIELIDEVLNKIKNGQRVSSINVVVSAITGVLFNLPGDRWGGSCQRDFIVIEPDGSTNSCPDRTSFEKAFSNVSDGAEAYIGSAPRRKWLRVQASTHKESHCHSCEFNTWCKSGCPIANNNPDKEKDCSGFKTYLLHVKKLLDDQENRSLLLEYAKPIGEPIVAPKPFGRA